MTQTTDLIIAKDIYKNFPTSSKRVDAVRGISLNVRKGDFLVIFGPSGCGKSTLLNILTGIDQPTSGSVEIAETNIFDMNDEQRGVFRSQKIGIVHQTSYWIKSLNAVENVAMPLVISGIPMKDALERAMESLKLIQVDELAHQVPNQLSGGEQQRVSIARALVSHPDIIVADEPTGNLDSTSSDQIISLLTMLNTKLNSTVLLVTHNPAYWDVGTIRVEMKDGEKLKETRHESIV